MGTHNIYLYKEADKKYTSCNLRIIELLDCALIGVCAVIKSNTVHESVNLSHTSKHYGNLYFEGKIFVKNL